jgi:hypothetical protein
VCRRSNDCNNYLPFRPRPVPGISRKSRLAIDGAEIEAAQQTQLPGRHVTTAAARKFTKGLDAPRAILSPARPVMARV